MPFVTAALAFALAAQSTAIFNIRPDDFWLNLHKFLYVLGRAENRAADARQAPVADAPADAWLAPTARSRASRPTFARRATVGNPACDHERRLVRKGGFEPPRSCDRQPLKLVRLPVPPLPRSSAE